MPRDSGGIYTKPAGTTAPYKGVVQSSPYNTYTTDVESEMNAVLPIIAGGTGGHDLPSAHASLMIATYDQKVAPDYNTFAFEDGYFWSDAVSSTNMPVAGHRFAGKAFKFDNSNIVLEARDLDDTTNPGFMYVRTMIAGAWGAWVMTDYNGDVTKQPAYNDQTVRYDIAQSLNSTQQAQARSNINALPKTGGPIGAITITGTVTVNGDITAYRPYSPSTGVIYLGNSNARYLYFDGSNYQLNAGSAYSSAGRLWGSSDFSQPLQLTGGTMTGLLASAYSSGAGIGGSTYNTIMVMGSPHAFLSFLVPGQYGMNVGMDGGGWFYIAGWSLGNVAYKIWSSRDFGAPPSSSLRLAWAGYASTSGSNEPINGGLVSGVDANSGTAYRYLQTLNSSGSWVTVGYS